MINVITISHKQQRYDTVGDWQFSESGALQITVSEMSDWRFEMLIAIHEIVEAILCKQAGISQEEVDEFDIKFTGEGEPGNAYNCPYYVQHMIATSVELLVAQGLKVDWQKYSKEIEKL